MMQPRVAVLKPPNPTRAAIAFKDKVVCGCGAVGRACIRCAPAPSPAADRHLCERSE